MHSTQRMCFKVESGEFDLQKPSSTGTRVGACRRQRTSSSSVLLDMVLRFSSTTAGTRASRLTPLQTSMPHLQSPLGLPRGTAWALNASRAGNVARCDCAHRDKAFAATGGTGLRTLPGRRLLALRTEILGDTAEASLVIRALQCSADFKDDLLNRQRVSPTRTGWQSLDSGLASDRAPARTANQSFSQQAARAGHEAPNLKLATAAPDFSRGPVSPCGGSGYRVAQTRERRALVKRQSASWVLDRYGMGRPIPRTPHTRCGGVDLGISRLGWMSLDQH